MQFDGSRLAWRTKEDLFNKWIVHFLRFRFVSLSSCITLEASSFSSLTNSSRTFCRSCANLVSTRAAYMLEASDSSW